MTGSTGARPEGLRIERYGTGPAGAAVLLPGAGYSPARPLLHFARLVLLELGWRVVEAWWDPPAEQDGADPDGWVAERAGAALDAAADGGAPPRRLVVGKSLASLAAPLVVERRVPACWLTPLLGRPAVRSALARAAAPQLLIGGGADRSWSEREAAGLPGWSVTLPGADHGLEVPGDTAASLAALERTVAELRTFARRTG